MRPRPPTSRLSRSRRVTGPGCPSASLFRARANWSTQRSRRPDRLCRSGRQARLRPARRPDLADLLRPSRLAVPPVQSILVVLVVLAGLADLVVPAGLADLVVPAGLADLGIPAGLADRPGQHRP